MTVHATHLVELARRVAATFVERAAAAAALVTGSTADGTSDEWSDVDLILFYDAWPGAAAIEQARTTLGGSNLVTIGGDPGGASLLEQLHVDGVAVQIVHQTIDEWRSTAATVLVELDTGSPVQKALDGLHKGIALHGEDVIAMLRADAGYPPALRAAMVQRNLAIFPLWTMQEALARRDAELWQRSELVAGLQRVLGMLAGVNAVWFSTFQLKHLRALVERFTESPANLVTRIEDALTAPMPDAASMLESLVDETLAIVERALPDVDVQPLRRQVGRRIEPWALP